MKKAAHLAPHKPKPKPKLPKVQHVKHEEDEPLRVLPKPVPRPPSQPISNPGPKPQPKAKAYTQEDWQKEVAEHVQPGRPIPDWLSAKAP